MTTPFFRDHGEGVTYRDGGVADVDAVAAVARAVRGGSVEDWRRAQLRAQARDGRLLVLATSGTDVVGYGQAHRCEPVGADDPAPPGLYLTGLDVLPAWRRRGVGRELTARRLDGIRKRGEPAWMFANARNHASLALHLALGFVEVGRAPSYLGVTFDGGVGVLLRADPLEGSRT